MPKYFEGSRPLPAETVRVSHEQITNENIRQLIEDNNGDCVLSVTLPGIAQDCLGYFFLVRNSPSGFEVRDMCNVVFFRDINIERLTKIIKHASGTEYDSEIQQEFYRIRNERGLDQ